jgi:adenylylsulfate kinase
MQYLNQTGMVIWLLGLSGSGKSTIATLLEEKLNANGYFTMSMDGDIIRSGLSRDLTFTEADRFENIRRAAELSKMMVGKDIITICSFITPRERHRDACRQILGNKYFEVYLDCPVLVCEERDVKGLYKKARNYEIENFTGVSSGFEVPLSPDLVLHTARESAAESVDKLYIHISTLIGSPWS